MKLLLTYTTPLIALCLMVLACLVIVYFGVEYIENKWNDDEEELESLKPQNKENK